ncbi:hypothetical protein F2Q70_00007791 [Brassica cretica]|uniref:C2H2-type domain-containing protein n=1 Tax=Brassica cretica TaxID=69181 RepID=A0A8S9LXI2_BRACR|nr:hypothetical protein F2Q70_00007791 [Brassica cretica]
MSFEVRLRWIGFWVPALASCSIYRLRCKGVIGLHLILCVMGVKGVRVIVYKCVQCTMVLHTCTGCSKNVHGVHIGLIVQPVMEIGTYKSYGWGKWDDEIEDRKVEYMVGLIVGGHNFKKSKWGWGDAKEIMYNHQKRKAEKKRKKQGAASTTNAGEGHVLKQRRLYMCTRDNMELSMDKKGDVDNLQEVKSDFLLPVNKRGLLHSPKTDLCQKVSSFELDDSLVHCVLPIFEVEDGAVQREEVRRECGKGFTSSTALCGHMACHFDREKRVSCSHFFQVKMSVKSSVISHGLV